MSDLVDALLKPPVLIFDNPYDGLENQGRTNTPARALPRSARPVVELLGLRRGRDPPKLLDVILDMLSKEGSDPVDRYGQRNIAAVWYFALRWILKQGWDLPPAETETFAVFVAGGMSVQDALAAAEALEAS